MIDVSLVNDPEYRWYHKEEMSTIMPFKFKRDLLGIKVIDYAELRQEYLSKIKEVRRHELNWARFRELIDAVDNSSSKKSRPDPRDMYHFERRDGCQCYLCGTISVYTQFHHKNPTGPITDDNIVTLCVPCHKMVHIALYASGKRKGFYP